jgi:hypothetical protein
VDRPPYAAGQKGRWRIPPPAIGVPTGRRLTPGSPGTAEARQHRPGPGISPTKAVGSWPIFFTQRKKFLIRQRVLGYNISEGRGMAGHGEARHGRVGHGRVGHGRARQGGRGGILPRPFFVRTPKNLYFFGERSYNEGVKIKYRRPPEMRPLSFPDKSTNPTVPVARAPGGFI